MTNEYLYFFTVPIEDERRPKWKYFLQHLHCPKSNWFSAIWNVAGKTIYYCGIFHVVSCYIAEIWVTFWTAYEHLVNYFSMEFSCSGFRLSWWIRDFYKSYLMKNCSKKCLYLFRLTLWHLEVSELTVVNARQWSTDSVIFHNKSSQAKSVYYVFLYV